MLWAQPFRYDISHIMHCLDEGWRCLFFFLLVERKGSMVKARVKAWEESTKVWEDRVRSRGRVMRKEQRS